MKKRILFISLLLGLSVSISNAQAASVYFGDTAINVDEGEKFEITLEMNFIDEATLGGGINVSWDAATVGLDSWDLSSTSGFDPGFSDKGTYSAGYIDNLYFGNFGGLSGPLDVATFQFSGLLEGNCVIQLTPNLNNPFASASTYAVIENVSFGSANISVTKVDEASPVPIPGAVWLLGSGLVGLVATRRKKKNS